MFIFIQLVFKLFLFSQVLYLLSVLFMFISQEDQCNAFLDAVYSCISVDDCDLIWKH